MTELDPTTTAINSALRDSEYQAARAAWILGVSGDGDKAPDELPQVDRAALASAHAQLAQAHALYGLLRSQAKVLEELEQHNNLFRHVAGSFPLAQR